MWTQLQLRNRPSSPWRLGRCIASLPAAVLLLASSGAELAVADSYEVHADLDFSVRDEGYDGFDQVLEGECCIRATTFQTFRIRGVAEFDLSSLPTGLAITSVTLRLTLVSGTGNNAADFFVFGGDGMATVEDGHRTDVPILENLEVVTSVVDINHQALVSLVQSRYEQGAWTGILFKLTLEHEAQFRDLEFAANGSNRALLLIEASPAPSPPPEVSPPGALVPFTVTRAAPGMLALAWETTAEADSYRIIMGDLGSLHLSGGVSASNAWPLACGITDVTTIIGEPASSVFLLVAGENPGGIGPLGNGAAGPRVADPDCP